MHITGSAKLAHTGIDNRIAGFAVLPGFQIISTVAPGKRLEFFLQACLGQIGIVIEELIRKFPPAQFRQELVAIIANNFGVLGFGNNARRTDFTPAQMRTKPRGGRFRRQITSLGIAGNVLRQK